MVCDFRDGVAHTREDMRNVDVGEIIVAPVAVRYDTEEEEGQQSVFWLVVLKTVSCYNFTEHLASLIQEIEQGANRSGRRNLQGTSGARLHELIYDVMLHQYRISPSVETLLDKQKAVRVNPLQRYHEIGTPDSIEAACSVFEMYRAMIYSLGGESVVRAVVFNYRLLRI